MTGFAKTSMAAKISDVAPLLEEDTYVQRALIADLKSMQSTDTDVSSFIETLLGRLSTSGRNRNKDVIGFLQQTALKPVSSAVMDILTSLVDGID